MNCTVWEYVASAVKSEKIEVQRVKGLYRQFQPAVVGHTLLLRRFVAQHICYYVTATTVTTK
jgi:hypothetical protein